MFGDLGERAQSVQIRTALRAQLRSIEALAPQIPSYADAFRHQLRAAFRLAQQRSYAADADPVAENRAALIALGVMFGHRRIASVVTELQNEALPTLDRAQHPKVDNRIDLARHFFTSAGLTVLTTEAIGFDIGQLKEELDAANRGGSGFSFADLGADHAGVRLAERATAGMQQAFAVQEALAELERTRDIVPELLDLPEGLTTQEVSARYGGTQGAGFAELVRTIAERIDALPLYARDRA